MIDPNILKSLESTAIDDDPSYSVIIKKISQPTKYCSKDQLQLIVHQINPNLLQIIQSQNNDIKKLKNELTQNNIPIPRLTNLSINNIVQKTLTIDSVLDFDSSNSMFISGIIGGITEESNQDISTTDEPNIKPLTSQHIESVTFTLASKIDIDFLFAYATIPGIIITANESSKLYSSYSLNFKQNDDNEYIGVTISFKNLKRKREYDNINVIIIGDEVV